MGKRVGFMRSGLKDKLFTVAPILFKHFKDNPRHIIDCPDDLFEFIFELSVKIEDFNRRFPKRRVRAMKVAMESGELLFVVHRQIFTVNKLIAATSAQIKAYRRNLKLTLLARAKAIGSTALYGSRLIPDWKRLMPDDKATLKKILEYAEKRAVVPQDHAQVAYWYKRLLGDVEKFESYQLFSPNGKECVKCKT